MRLSLSAGRGSDRPSKENAEQQLPGAPSRRVYGESGGCRPAGQQMRSPPSPGKAGEGGKAQVARELQLIPAVRLPDPDKHVTDPLYVGLPNYGNSCYQNATLQSLLGLRPFVSDMMSLVTDSESDQSRTFRSCRQTDGAPTERTHKVRLQPLQ